MRLNGAQNRTRTCTLARCHLKAVCLPVPPSGQCFGVHDRDRTGDRQDHNLELYQLSYVHRRNLLVSVSRIERETYCLEGSCSIH